MGGHLRRRKVWPIDTVQVAGHERRAPVQKPPVAKRRIIKRQIDFAATSRGIEARQLGEQVRLSKFLLPRDIDIPGSVGTVVEIVHMPSGKNVMMTRPLREGERVQEIKGRKLVRRDERQSGEWK